jgi:diacylglycerol O-acyltransferase / wax synthase
MSYDGRIEYGLLGDFDALPDIDVIAEGIDFALGELVSAAGGGATSNGTRAVSEPLLPTSRRRSTGGPATDMRAKRTKSGGRGGKPPQNGAGRTSAR